MLVPPVVVMALALASVLVVIGAAVVAAVPVAETGSSFE